MSTEAAAIDIPNVSKEQMGDFFTSHFSQEALLAFPVGQLRSEYAQQIDNPATELDLGFYEDGNRRTLTDDQIAIFRHSEIHGLRSERRREKENSESFSQSQVAITDNNSKRLIHQESGRALTSMNIGPNENDHESETEYEQFLLEERQDLARANYDKFPETEETLLDYGDSNQSHGSERFENPATWARRIISYEDISDTAQDMANVERPIPEQQRFYWPKIGN